MNELRHRAISGLVRTLSRMKPGRVTIRDRIAMPYLTAGHGEPLILLHGFADQKETWSLIAPLLARRFKVIAPDLPGYGDAGAIQATQAHLAEQATFLEAFLDRMGLDRVHLCGNSMGGGVALTFAARQPRRVRSLTLISSMGPEEEPSELRRSIDEGHNPLLPASWPEYEAMLDFIFERRPKLPGAVWKHMATRHIERRDRYDAQFEHLTDSLEVEFGALRMPTLIVHGRQDRLIHRTTGESLARQIPDTRLIMLDDVGHAPQWEAPRRTVVSLQSFLAQVHR